MHIKKNTTKTPENGFLIRFSRTKELCFIYDILLDSENEIITIKILTKNKTKEVVITDPKFDFLKNEKILKTQEFYLLMENYLKTKGIVEKL